MRDSRLPHPAAGGEIAGNGGAERDHGHGVCHYAQRPDRARVAYPQKAYRLRTRVQEEKRRRAEGKAVDKAAPHGAAYAPGALTAYLLGYEPRRRKPHAGDGEGRAQKRHGHDQLIKPYAGRADAPGQPHLKGHRDQAHKERRARQQRGIHDQSFPSYHTENVCKKNYLYMLNFSQRVI